jgi:hypothetical protein
MKVLELFCGTKSVGNVWEQYGWEITSVDIEKKFSPDILANVLDWDYKIYQPGYFDVIWASPPCTCFSALKKSNIGRGKMTRESFNKELDEIGIPLLRKTEEIITYFNPTYWFMENPMSGDMKKYTIFDNWTDVAYCRYGFPYKKATRIWTNTTYMGKFCNHKGKHQNVIGGMRGGFSKYEKYRIPAELVDEIGNFVTNSSEPILD